MRERLVGVDVARGVALVGMVCTHVAPSPIGAPVSWWDAVPGGRASALFAVLAGVGIGLGTGGPTPVTGSARAAARRALPARAAVVAIIGLTLGGLPTPAAVILVYYGLLFPVALPVLGWRPGRLLATAAGVALVAPVVSHLLRALDPRPPGPNVGWTELFTDPLGLGRTLLLDGYYPVLQWSAYLLLGLALGRLDLGRRRVAATLVAAGTGAALLGLAVGALTLRLAGGAAALGAGTAESADQVLHRLATSSYGVAPTSSWWWLGTAGRHSGTTPDLLHTAGSAVAVLGVCLLLAGVAGRATRRRLLGPPAALGAVPLTLYTLHVLLLGAAADLPPVAALPVAVQVAGHLAVALAVAAWIGAPARRGPLESLAAAAGRAHSRRDPPRAGPTDPDSP